MLLQVLALRLVQWLVHQVRLSLRLLLLLLLLPSVFALAAPQIWRQL